MQRYGLLDPCFDPDFQSSVSSALADINNLGTRIPVCDICERSDVDTRFYVNRT